MSDDISLRPVSSSVDFGCQADLAADSGDADPTSAIRLWRKAIAEVLASHTDADAHQLEASLPEDADTCESPAEDIDPYERAARIGVDAHSTDHGDAPSLARALLFLKHQGFEFGRSPAEHWRHHRLLNAGSRALDALLDDPRLRRCATSTLFFRLVRRAMERGSLHDGGLSGEIVCELPWTGDGDHPWRHPLPARESGGGWTDTIVDWLLEQLVARGLMSLTLGSVIEEGDGERDYAVDDALGRWMRGLPGEEGRFIAGTLFAPARLGGWPQSVDQRVDDAAAVAGRISDDFVPDDTRHNSYARHLRRVDSLRRIPDELSPTYEVFDGDSTWKGRFAAVLHPVRRNCSGDTAYATVEAGMVFEEPRPALSTWSSRKKNALRSKMLSVVRDVDDDVFRSFGALLDEVVDCIHHSPGALRSGPSNPGAEPSPLSRGFQEGYDELCNALKRGDTAAVTDGLRRWTFPLCPSTED